MMPTMHNFTVFNESGSTEVPSEDQFFQWFSAAVADDWPESEVDLMLVNAEKMAEINNQARGKDYPTNTLAFPFDEENQDTPLFGEIIMCPEVIRQQANDQGITAEAHWAHLTIHSTLHLMGFDHQEDDEAEQMEQREINTLAQFGISNPYLPQETP